MNDDARASFWAEFICEKSTYPEPQKLNQQFSEAKFGEFCQCGCNSFKVHIPENTEIPPLTTPGKYGAFFECAFHLGAEEKTLEIILFTNESGYLTYVEVDCCGNSEPVPESVVISKPPYHVHHYQKVAT